MKGPAGECPIIEGWGEALGICKGLGNERGFGEFPVMSPTPGDADCVIPAIDGGDARLKDVAGDEPKVCWC